MSRPFQGPLACLNRANNGSPAASLWKSCFAEAINIHLSLPLTGMGYPFRYSEMGLNLKVLGHRLPSFCISHLGRDAEAGKTVAQHLEIEPHFRISEWVTHTVQWQAPTYI